MKGSGGIGLPWSQTMAVRVCRMVRYSLTSEPPIKFISQYTFGNGWLMMTVDDFMKKVRTSFFLLVFLLLLISVGVDASAPIPTPGADPQITVLEDKIQITWHSPKPTFSQMGSGNFQVEMDGFNRTEMSGIPDLPAASVLVALPPGADPKLEIISTQEKGIIAPGSLRRNLEPNGVLRGDQGEILGGDYSASSEEITFNPAVVELEMLGILRGVSLARLVYYPVIPNELSTQNFLKWFSQVEVVLHLNQSVPGVVNTRQISDPLLRALRSQVINPQHVQAAARVLPASVNQITAPAAVNQVALVEVSQKGITEITYQALNAAGFPVASVNPHFMHLTHLGNQVAIEWDGDLDSNFKSGERFLFYATPRTSRWTNTDVYFLSEETSIGSRIQIGSGSPTGLPPGMANADLLVEENVIYTPESLFGTLPMGWDGDRWVWEKLNQPLNTQGNYNFPLPSVNTSQPGTVTLWMLSFTDVAQIPDHNVAIYLNGNPLTPGTVTWNGKQLQTSLLSVPTGTFSIGNNTLTISLPGLPGVTVEGMWVDAFQVDYVLGTNSVGNNSIFQGEENQSAYSITLDNLSDLRIYDVTTPTNVVRVLGYDSAAQTVTLGDPIGGGVHRYAIANQDGVYEPEVIHLKEDLATGNGGFQGADYVIITHDDFSSALGDLVALRESQGLEVVVETVQAIYDHYDDGRPTPDAIRSFLDDAYHNWIRPPIYVLLVGDGTADPKHYQPNSFNTYIPPYLADVDPWAGETAADNRYATLDGTDILPDILIGRLPVNNLTEAQVVIDKIVDYETGPPPGDWYETLVFVADDQDSGGNFPADAEGLINSHIPGSYTVERVYHSDSIPPSQTQTDLLQKWNNGPGLITYVGHGSQHTWGGETFLHISNIAGLVNEGRLPVTIELTCLTGSFHTSGLDAIDEEMLRFSGGGSVAVWGPTGLGLSNGHVQLAEGFLQNTYQFSRPLLGKAILAGKVRLMTNVPAYQDLVDTYTLFGDPAQLLHVFPMNVLYLPLVLH